MMQYKKGRAKPWMVQIRLPGNKRRTEYFGSAEEAAEFEHSERKKVDRQKKGLLAPVDRTLVIDYAAYWIRRRYAEADAGARSHESVSMDDSRLRNFWLERIGTKLLDQVTSSEIAADLDRLMVEMKHSPADRNRHRALLHKMFRDAVMDGKAENNPITRVPIVPEPSAKKKHRKRLADEARDAYVGGLYAHGPEFGIVGEVMLWTGARIGTALALQWRDIDFERGVLVLRRTVVGGGRVVDRQKGHGTGGETVLPLFPALKKALLAHRERSNFVRPSDFVATHKDGSVITRYSFRCANDAAIKDAKVGHIGPHDIRATFATAAQKAGFSKEEIKEMLGHSTTQVTERYTLDDVDHLIEKAKRIGFGSEPTENVVRLRGKK